jgi:carboxylesterase
MPEHAILPGAEPFSAPGGPHGALVLHGFTGSPQSMRGLAEAFGRAAFAVELPLLPGHGTAIEDMLETGWGDWSRAAEGAYQELAARCDSVVVAGLSMGGTLTLWLAERHPEIAGIVLVNPAVDPPAESFREMLQGFLDSGNPTMPAVGNDIADSTQTELAYDATPVAPLLSMLEADDEIAALLGSIECPVLLMNSPQDHVVPPESSDMIAERVSGPLERVTLERSYHVATLDYDKDEIERRAVDFAKKVTASGR